MHIPDGFIDARTSLAGAAAAAGLVGVSVKQAARTLDDRQIPLAGLTAAYIFALQMLNFPVVSGTSGHLLGGCMAAVLVGPWVGSLCMAVVFMVQALVFADGGLSALGLNIIVMGYVTCFVGYGIFLLLRSILPPSRRGVTVSAAVAAWCGVIASALVFVLYYAIGGTGGASIRTVMSAMVGVHALVGIGEGAPDRRDRGSGAGRSPGPRLRRPRPHTRPGAQGPGDGWGASDGPPPDHRRLCRDRPAGRHHARLVREPLRQLPAGRAGAGLDRHGIRQDGHGPRAGRRAAGRLRRPWGRPRAALDRAEPGSSASCCASPSAPASSWPSAPFGPGRLRHRRRPSG